MTEITRPQSPSVADKQTTGFRPDELNPDLAAATMARDLVAKLPNPAIVSKKFAVYQGIWTALNNSETNPTGYDCSMRLAVYASVAETSVNVDGAYFKNLWAYLMRPKMIIQGLGGAQSPFEEEQPGLVSRLWGRLTGRGQPQENKTS